MKIVDLTDLYLETEVLAEYIKSFPELFDHYFKYWANKENWHRTLNKTEVYEKLDIIRERLEYIENKFKQKGFNISDLEIILFVGQGTTNGHSFKYENKFKVFIPIETYKSKKEVEVFITHEIVHALHYKQNPDLYFNSKKEKENTKRQLITEGVATYLTKEILGITDEEALWADYLPEDELENWMNECIKEKDNLIKEINENNNNIKEIFLANDPNNIRKYRSGYFIGLELIKEKVNKEGLSIKEVLEVRKLQF